VVERLMLILDNYVRRALSYHDWHFRKHEAFPFIEFWISQHRPALNSGCVQMRRKKKTPLISKVTLQKLD
jgi:hypothetical protein